MEEKPWGEQSDDLDESTKYTPEIEVKGPDDLVKEFERLAGFLQDLNPPWQSRMSSLHRFQNLVTAGEVTRFENFLSALQILKKPLAAQIADRRSKVVKETAVTLSVLTRGMKDFPSAPEHHSIFVSTMAFLTEELFQTIPQTVKVISEAGKAGLKEILENITDDINHTLLRVLIEGTKHKHQTVRAACFEFMPLLLAAFKKNEDESSLLNLLVEAIERGLADSNAQARAASRLCLVEFSSISPVDCEKVVSKLPSSVLKLYQQDLEKHKGTGASKPKESTKPKVEPRARIPLRSRLAQKTAPPSEHPSSTVLEDAAETAKAKPTKRESVDLTNSVLAEVINLQINSRSRQPVEEKKDPQATVAAPSNEYLRLGLTQSPNYDKDNLLMSKLLDLESPQVTPKMKDFLLQDGVIDVLVGFISRFSSAELSLLIEDLRKSSVPRVPASPSRIRSLDGLVPPPFPFTAESKRPSDDVLAEFSLSSPLQMKNVRPRPSSELEALAVRRSYQAMTILSERYVDLRNIMHYRIRPIMLHILGVFHPNSQGNFYHACKVLSELVRYFRNEVFEVLLSPEGSVLFRLVFDNLHEPPVCDAVMHLLCTPSDKMEKLYKLILQDWKIIKIITTRICDPRESEATSSSHVAFFERFLDLIVVHPSAVMLISSLCAPNSLVDSLIDAVCNNQTLHPAWQRLQCASLLGSLLKRSSSQLVPESSPVMNVVAGASHEALMPNMVPNPLSDMFPHLVKKILPSVDRICNALTHTARSPSAVLVTGDRPLEKDADLQYMEVEGKEAEKESLDTDPHSPLPIKFAAFTVERGFTQLRLALLAILCELSTSPATSTELVEKIPQSTWTSLVAWLFQYRHNNMFLTRFLTLFRAALHDTSANSPISFLLNKCKLLDQLMNFFRKEHPACSLDAFIIEMCNHLRLSGDVNHPIVKPFLEQNRMWSPFLPVLREQTLKQVERQWDTPPRKSVSQPINHLPSADPVHGAPGIDLGSTYARRLGYE